MVDVLERVDIGGKLLILGQPGGGKTTTLLNLAEELLERVNRLDLWQEIQRNVDFSELARTPLLLSMMVVAYQGRAIQTKQDLFDTYIDYQLKVVDHRLGLELVTVEQKKKIKHFLVFLAKRLQETQTEFLIENMQPYWLQNRQQRWVYKLIFGLILWPLFGLVVLSNSFFECAG